MADTHIRKNLGRGLDALLGEDTDDGPHREFSTAGAPSENHVSVDLLAPGKYQPRHRFNQNELAELAESIRGNGILQPILVRPNPEQPGAYEIIAGERRWRAAQLAQLHEVPVLVKDLNDAETLEIALVENLQRENLSSLEEAEGYERLIQEFNHTQDALGQILGKSRSHVANTLRLLNLPDEIKAHIESGKLSAGHGRALLAADDPLKLAQIILAQELNVRQTEKLVKKGASINYVKTTKKQKDADTLALEKNLSTFLGLKVAINFTDPGGKISITYKNLEQLDEVLYILTGGQFGRASSHGADGDTDLEFQEEVDKLFPVTLDGEFGSSNNTEADNDDPLTNLNLSDDFGMSDDVLKNLPNDPQADDDPLANILSDDGSDHQN